MTGALTLEQDLELPKAQLEEKANTEQRVEAANICVLNPEKPVGTLQPL